jgi:hypothetical protein
VRNGPGRLAKGLYFRPVRRYSRFYRGPQPEVDLVLAYERGDIVLLVPFAERCATSCQER